MARANDESGSLRFSRREIAGLIIALLLSLLTHLGVWDGIDVGNKHGWWKKILKATWLQSAEKKFALQAAMAAPERPDIFVDVSHADADAPERTKYYSSKNSRAANPEIANSNVPKINGSQTDVPKTEDVPKPVKAENKAETASTPKPESAKPESSPKFTQLQPTLPPPQLAQPDLSETPQTPGETELARVKRPANTSAAQPAQAQPARPRTLKQALAQRDQIAGQQMRQSGGVSRNAMWSSLDAKATPFGEYDRAIIEAVQQRWYDLLDNHRYAQDRSGKVILKFKLKPDGTVIEMQTLENSVGEVLGYLCQEAIEEAAPFAKWPSDMAHEIGTNSRDITFTFYYY
jgi:hypothetical protein